MSEFLLTLRRCVILTDGNLYSRKRNRQKKNPVVMLCVVFLMYLIVITLWIIDLVDIVGEIRIAFVKNPDVDLGIRYGQAREFVRRRIAAIDVLYGYLSIGKTCIGDGVIIWRAYAFWSTSDIRYIVIALPVALLLASVACAMMLTYCVDRLGGEIVLGAFEHPLFCRRIQTVSYAVPAVTTAITTLLIAIKVWSLVKFWRANEITDNPLSKKSRLQTIVVLLIETGVAYFLFFLAQVIIVAPDVHAGISAKPGLAFATNVFAYQTSSIVGMYPTIIICLVHVNRSSVDTTLVYTETGHNSRNPDSHRRAPLSLGSFRAVPPSFVMSAGRDVESRGEAVNLQVFRSVPSEGDHGDSKLGQKHQKLET
ncbi:hypothetical protein L218DRAFT_886199 [Marasmius fiardii PR-910]|nr:hypothetical protein L218DRAFT_886199 [Marasmius fiardii PR-910]